MQLVTSARTFHLGALNLEKMMLFCKENLPKIKCGVFFVVRCGFCGAGAVRCGAVRKILVRCGAEKTRCGRTLTRMILTLDFIKPFRAGLELP